MEQIRKLESPEAISACFPVMRQLRPALIEDQFVSRVLRQQSEGYQLVGISSGETVVGVAGFRVLESLGHGKFIYIDDLVVDESARSKRFGEQLFTWVLEKAKAEGCEEVRLDCGVQRFDSHRFYHRRRMKITAHHFVLPIAR